jgi:hypothetical protein
VFLWRKYVVKEPLVYEWSPEHGWLRGSETTRSKNKNISKRKKVQWNAILATPACSIDVFRILRDFYSEPLPSGHPDCPKIRIPVLPTRLFKALSIETSAGSASKDHAEQLDAAYQYVDLLLSDHGASPDKLGGYPLARSVLSGNLPFVRLLLSHGASPAIKQNLVIMVAIETGDLELVRLLIEPGFIHSKESVPLNHDPLKLSYLNKVHSNLILKHHQQHKKIRLEDRVQVSDQMLERAIRRRDAPMAQYFIERGQFSFFRFFSSSFR